MEAPALPHTWRPFGVRLAIWVFGGMLLVLVVGSGSAWAGGARAVHLLPARHARADVQQFLLFLTYNSLVRSKVIATEEGLTWSTATASGTSSGRR